MPWHYSTKERKDSQTALPNIETFQALRVVCMECSASSPCMPGESIAEVECIECGAHNHEMDAHEGEFWWYAFGLPGCVWDSSPCGYFDTEGEAVSHAREDAGDDHEEFEFMVYVEEPIEHRGFPIGRFMATSAEEACEKAEATCSYLAGDLVAARTVKRV